MLNTRITKGLNSNRKLLSLRRYKGVGYIVNSLQKIKEAGINDNIKSTEQHKKEKVPQRKAENLISPNDLYYCFKYAEEPVPLNWKLAKAQSFFNNSSVDFLWSLDEYDGIPDVKYSILKDQIIEDNQKKSHEVTTEKLHRIRPPAHLLKQLPEVLFIGHTNAGKSTLINNLLMRKQQQLSKSLQEYAYVSKRSGYTKTLNCFDINNRIRFVDSPGYGLMGKENQGKAVIDYISQRRNLCKVYVLLDSVCGFAEADIQLISLLTEYGVSFDIVFTKVDKIIQRKSKPKHGKRIDKCQSHFDNSVAEINESIIEHFENLVEQNGIRDLPSLPKLFFSNSELSSRVPKRYGYNYLRCGILESCGLL